MVNFDAKSLERRFKAAAAIRITAKEKGNKDYAGDAGYWTGGQCQWGGSHNLQEDCQTIVKLLSKLDELKNTKEELQKCTSEQEFNANKSRITRQAQEVENSLRSKTGPSASVGGICIIWEEYINFIESELKPLRNEVNRLKDQISKEQYKYYEEIKLLKLEQKKIENRMKENKRKAQVEKDPTQKALLLQMIEDDGKSLKENLEKQKTIPTSNLNFNPDKYVSDFVEAMINAVKNSKDNNKNKPTGSGKKNKNSTNSNTSDSESDDNSDENINSTNNGASNQPKKEDNSDWYQENKQLILIGGVTLLIILYLYSQKDEEESLNTLYNYNF